MKVLMPQLGETVNEGTISAWHRSVGDEVAKDEVLLDVETEKVAVEIPAPVAGVLSSILVEEGETVDVGTVLAVISGEGEEDADEPVERTETEVAGEPVSEKARPAATPAARGELKLSPAVRRLVAEHGLDASAIEGTGRDGRITRRDVLAHIESAAPPAAGTAAAPTETGQVIPFNRIRQLTAEHMVRSKATSPHVLQAIEADFSRVDKVRVPQRLQWKERHGYSLSYLPFVARAVCIALADFPRLNASVEGDGLKVHAQVNMAIAVDLGHEGLVAPVVQNAGALSVAGLAHAFNDLAQRARGKKLTTDDFENGTYTLSNPGPFGTLFTAPIINQPQVAILSMDAIRKRPVVVETEHGDTIGIRPVGVLAQSFDHRAVDGAYSAAFLNRVSSLLAEHDWAAELES